MMCCGRARPPAETRPPRPSAPAAAAQIRPTTVAFVYTGPTRLVAEGPVTWRRYRFEHPGAIVVVDVRDAPSFAAIPHLRRAP